MLIFFKYYDPAEEKIIYMGHMIIAITLSCSRFVPDLISRAKLPPGTPLSLYEERQPNYLEKIENLEKPLELSLELMDGDIIVFQKATVNNFRLVF